MTDALRGLPFLAVWLFFLYEWLAVSFPALGVPSISAMTYGQLSGFHPLMSVALGVVGGALITLLVLHLTGLLPWWRP